MFSLCTNTGEKGQNFGKGQRGPSLGEYMKLSRNMLRRKESGQLIYGGTSMEFFFEAQISQSVTVSQAFIQSVSCSVSHSQSISQSVSQLESQSVHPSQ